MGMFTSVHVRKCVRLCVCVCLSMCMSVMCVWACVFVCKYALAIRSPCLGRQPGGSVCASPAYLSLWAPPQLPLHPLAHSQSIDPGSSVPCPSFWHAQLGAALNAQSHQQHPWPRCLLSLACCVKLMIMRLHNACCLVYAASSVREGTPHEQLIVPQGSRISKINENYNFRKESLQQSCSGHLNPNMCCACCALHQCPPLVLLSAFCDLHIKMWNHRVSDCEGPIWTCPHLNRTGHSV